jgi:hypothetical protein
MESNLAISRAIYANLIHEEIVIDFFQLALFRGQPKMRLRVGADFVNYFTHSERMNTVGRSGISFIDFMNNKDGVLGKAYVQKMIDWYQETEPWRNETWILYRIFNLYFGSINILQPHIAVSVYDRFKPTCVLSPCAGWGGLLTAACAYSVPRWIGCETNEALKEPYMKMIHELHKHSSTEIDMNWVSCLDFDYHSVGYDMVFYSPPYYNIERYTDQPYRTKAEWNDFYEKLCLLSWRGLMKGGWYCVVVSNEIYDVYKKIIGWDADIIIPMPNKRRSAFHIYSENVFCWHR